jgi:ferredoxin
MAEFRNRIPENVPGKFYVDDQCIYCDLCREIAPNVFREERPWGWASVFRQPSTAEEIALAVEALEGCPVEAIGSDGDHHDWSIAPSPPLPLHPMATTQRKRWWKFWESAQSSV